MKLNLFRILTHFSVSKTKYGVLSILVVSLTIGIYTYICFLNIKSAYLWYYLSNFVNFYIYFIFLFWSVIVNTSVILLQTYFIAETTSVSKDNFVNLGSLLNLVRFQIIFSNLETLIKEYFR